MKKSVFKLGLRRNPSRHRPPPPSSHPRRRRRGRRKSAQPLGWRWRALSPRRPPACAGSGRERHTAAATEAPCGGGGCPARGGMAPRPVLRLGEEAMAVSDQGVARWHSAAADMAPGATSAATRRRWRGSRREGLHGLEPRLGRRVTGGRHGGGLAWRRRWRPLSCPAPRQQHPGKKTAGAGGAPWWRGSWGSGSDTAPAGSRNCGT
ncbi:hypothetical protein PVAP13_5NG034608 [Panicum virgatum]|uniref:Uncharacterized protein n=1 Tax=Panicum virgatum TaxID=38727 RepID=A0A8T0RJI2_PANVG|nr:hypothetical protein PVAP13_5NG034608 [Panicum virgatum]